MNIDINPKNPEANAPAGTALTQQQVTALPLLAAGLKKKDAAVAAGVCPQTVSEWLREPQFSAALRIRRDELAAIAGARIGEATEVAIATLLELMQYGSETTRLKASIFCLDGMLSRETVISTPDTGASNKETRDLLAALGVNVV